MMLDYISNQTVHINKMSGFVLFESGVPQSYIGYL